MALKVAIVGLSPSTRGRAWLHKGWEVWGLGWDAENRYRFDRVFEPHDMQALRTFYGEMLGAYLDKLAHCETLYMTDKHIPNARRFPFEDVGDDVGAYWCSSVAYMLSLAIHERAEEIALYGIDMNDDYGYQRPNTEYLIGLARGRGIRVHIPDESPLCKYVPVPGYAAEDGRYGRTK